MAFKNPSLLLFVFSVFTALSLFKPCIFLAADSPTPSSGSIGGAWCLLRSSIGVSAMHMQLLKNNKVVIFDRMDMGPSNLSVPNDKCISKPQKHIDCTAHSLLYDVASNTVRALLVRTDTWCSSGSVDPNGTLIQTGGYTDGDHAIRTFAPCNDDKCDWKEMQPRVNLTERRWYASNQILPDGRVIVVGGRSAFTYEFFPKTETKPSSFYMRFLRETMDRPREENNLYPFLHLLPDGNLYVFANNRSILFDYNRNRVVKEFPVMPGGDRRNYPSTGSSALLPLRLNGTDLPPAEVLICGGAPYGAFQFSDKKRVFVYASRTCGRLRLTDPEPKWAMEEMPMPRVMSDMLLLPSGEVILINGAMNGTAGWEDATNPVLNPVLYRPNEPDPERRFVVLNPTKIPRMYHSSAILLPDGRVLVGGSNPHQRYNFTAKYPTDLSLEAYHPYYMDPENANKRPSILTVESREMMVSYREVFSITFVLKMCHPDTEISVALITPSFSTHSYNMNQRMLLLQVGPLEQLSTYAYKIKATGPPTASVAPAGYYMLFVVHAGIPSTGVWVKVH